MSCPFKAAVKNEIELIKNQSSCTEKGKNDENCQEISNDIKCETVSGRDVSPSHKIGRDLSPSNKQRKESGLSLSSQASSDELDEGERKLGLVALIESVGTLLLPSVSYEHINVIYN